MATPLEVYRNSRNYGLEQLRLIRAASPHLVRFAVIGGYPFRHVMDVQEYLLTVRRTYFRQARQEALNA